MIVIFPQTGLLEQCRWHMYGLGVLVQVPLNFLERAYGQPLTISGTANTNSGRSNISLLQLTDSINLVER